MGTLRDGMISRGYARRMRRRFGAKNKSPARPDKSTESFSCQYFRKNTQYFCFPRGKDDFTGRGCRK